MDEQNNELLMKNHKSRPTGYASFLEVNVTTNDHYNYGQTHDRGRGSSCGFHREHGHEGTFQKTSYHQKWKNNVKNEKEKGGPSSKHVENTIIIMVAKTIGHIPVVHQSIDLYWESLKNKEKMIQIHFAYENGDYGHMETTHLDVVYFFIDPNVKIDHFIGDGSVKK